MNHLRNKEITPLKDQQFWCDECDAVLVDSNKPDSGKFFMQSGCAIPFTQLGNIKEYGDYAAVVFAICAQCLKG